MTTTNELIKEHLTREDIVTIMHIIRHCSACEEMKPFKEASLNIRLKLLDVLFDFDFAPQFASLGE